MSAFIEYYSFPVEIYLEDGSFILMDKAEFVENGIQLLTVYGKPGMRSVTFHIARVEALNPSCLPVDAEWLLLGSNKQDCLDLKPKILSMREMTI